MKMALSHYLYPRFPAGQIGLIHFFHLVASGHNMSVGLWANYNYCCFFFFKGLGFLVYIPFFQFSFTFSLNTEYHLFRLVHGGV